MVSQRLRRSHVRGCPPPPHHARTRRGDVVPLSVHRGAAHWPAVRQHPRKRHRHVRAPHRHHPIGMPEAQRGIVRILHHGLAPPQLRLVLRHRLPCGGVLSGGHSKQHSRTGGGCFCESQDCRPPPQGGCALPRAASSPRRRATEACLLGDIQRPAGQAQIYRPTLAHATEISLLVGPHIPRWCVAIGYPHPIPREYPLENRERRACTGRSGTTCVRTV